MCTLSFGLRDTVAHVGVGGVRLLNDMWVYWFEFFYLSICIMLNLTILRLLFGICCNVN